LETLRPTPKPTTITPLSQNFNSLNSRKTKICTSGKIQTLREENHYHFCGEIGHIKRTCSKKQVYNKTKRNPSQSTKILPTSISFEQEFLESARGLTQLRNHEVSLDELLKIRTIVNTLIYYYPTHNKSRGNNSNIF